jgi:hypothetical protein
MLHPIRTLVSSFSLAGRQKAFFTPFFVNKTLVSIIQIVFKDSIPETFGHHLL